VHAVFGGRLHFVSFLSARFRRGGLVERLELFAQDAALLELGEPGLDEGLALGLAVAAAAVDDPVLGDASAERAAGER
jgi:hypothetical protein